MGPSVKALAIFFTSLAAAKPILQPQIVARSASVASTTSTTTPTASDPALSNTNTVSTGTILQDGVSTSTTTPTASDPALSNTNTVSTGTIPGVSTSVTTPTASGLALSNTNTVSTGTILQSGVSTGTTAKALPTNFNDLCSQTYTPALWEQYNMDSFIQVEATALQPFNTSYQQALMNMLPGLAGKDYTCGFDQPCVTYAVTQVCTENPQAAYALLAIAHFSNYFQTIFSTIETAVTTMTPAFATFPETFNPGNITVLPDSSETSIIAAASWLLGSMAALGGMVASGIEVEVEGSIQGISQGTLSAIANAGGIVYSVGSFATIAGLNDTSSDLSVEVEFDSYAAIEGTLSQMQKNLTSGISNFVTSRLGSIPEDGDNGQGSGTAYEFDPSQLPQLLLNGTFAAPIGDLGPNVASGFTAALAAPGINELWNYQSAVVVKVSKNSLPSDPCQGDNLVPAASKYCDSNGNAFLIHVPAAPAGGATAGFQLPIDNITAYDAPGFDQIGKYNLTVQGITQSAWKLQQSSGAGSSGPSVSALNSYIMNTGVINLQLEDYVFFNFPVCDLDSVPISSGENSQITDYTCNANGSSPLGTQNGDPTVCTYLLKMTCLCNLGNYGSGQWPWTGNLSTECTELSSY